MPKTTSQLSTERNIVVIDTSSLVNDPAALYAFPNADVVIPLVVVEELDGHKARPDEVGRAAREVIRTLEKLREEAGGSLNQAHPLPAGATLRIELNGLQLERLTSLGLDVTKGDNRLLAAALGLDAQHSGQVIVISSDAAVRLKAGQLGLRAVDHVQTRRRDAIGEASPGWATVDTNMELVERLFESKQVNLDVLAELDPVVAKADANTGFVLKAGASSALARLVGDSPSGPGRLRLLNPHVEAWGMRPKNKEQRFALELLLDPDVTVVGLSGPGGTGKTMACLAAALEQVFEPSHRRYDRLMIIRPMTAVGRQDVGFLPGDLQDKIGPWYEAIVDAMVALGDDVTHKAARDILDGWVTAEQLVMEPVTFLRGRSLKNHFILVDEAQNLSPEVLKTILTRVGEGSKVVFTGDVTQQDAPYLSETNNALAVLVDRFGGEDFFGHLHLTAGVRSRVAERAAELL